MQVFPKKIGISSRLLVGDKEVIQANFKIIMMVKNGFSTHAIANAVGMTHSQVQYRIKLYALQGARSDYRHNLTHESAVALKRVMAVKASDRKEIMQKFSSIRNRTLDRIAELRSLNK